MRRILVPLLAGSLVMPGVPGLSGQVAGTAAGAPAVGDRIRVRVERPTPQVRVGTFRGTRGDALVLGTGDARTDVIPFLDLSGVEVHAGTRRHPVAGALIGLGVGLAAVGLRAVRYCPSTVDGVCVTEPPGGGFFHDVPGAALAGGGLVVGALVGLALKTDAWSDVAWPPAPGERIQVRLTGAGGGPGPAGFGLTVRIPY